MGLARTVMEDAARGVERECTLFVETGDTVEVKVGRSRIGRVTGGYLSARWSALDHPSAVLACWLEEQGDLTAEETRGGAVELRLRIESDGEVRRSGPPPLWRGEDGRGVPDWQAMATNPGAAGLQLDARVALKRLLRTADAWWVVGQGNEVRGGGG